MSKDGEHTQQAPTVEAVGDSAHFESKETHPSYGMIGANRVTGGSGSFLFGSDFKHNHYVTIQISEAELHRGLNRDWPFATKRLIEIALSEAQWATFVASPNIGSGVQCTLRWNNSEGWLPEIELPLDRKTQFMDEMLGMFKEAVTELGRLATDVKASKTLSQKSKDALTSRISRVQAELGAHGERSGLGWVEKSFDEHMEMTVEKAKIEVNAYLTSAIQRAGITALESGDAPIALIEGPAE